MVMLDEFDCADLDISWRPGAKPFPSFLAPWLDSPQQINLISSSSCTKFPAHRRRPLLPPFRRVESDGVGVTSSILPIFIPERARARKADWAPGPGVLVPFPKAGKLAWQFSRLLGWPGIKVFSLPPVARMRMWSALMPSSLHLAATSWAANIAA